MCKERRIVNKEEEKIHFNFYICKRIFPNEDNSMQIFFKDFFLRFFLSYSIFFFYNFFFLLPFFFCYYFNLITKISQSLKSTFIYYMRQERETKCKSKIKKTKEKTNEEIEKKQIQRDKFF